MTTLDANATLDVAFPLHPKRDLATQDCVYRGGPLLADFELVTVFWGAEWLLPPAPHGSYWKRAIPLVGYVTSFIDALVASGYFGLLAEYSVGRSPLGQGHHRGSALSNDPVVSAPGFDARDSSTRLSVSPERVMDHLDQWLTCGLLPELTGNVTYLILTEPGVGCADPTGMHRSQNIVGYHWATSSGFPFILLTPAIQYVDEPLYGRHLPDVPTPAESARLTRQISQALVDTVTNPLPLTAPGWCSDRGIGLATASAGEPPVAYHGFEVAPFWSRARSRKLPVPSAPA